MPEMLTKHPEIALNILKEANIKCGVGEKQKILTSCPKDKFCSLPTGELCIYGTKDISQMTQISAQDLLFLPHVFSGLLAVAVLISAIGVMIGIHITKK